MANNWNAEIENYLNSFTFNFDSEEDKDKLRQFYRKFVAQRISSPPFRRGNAAAGFLAYELGKHDNIAIIPFLPKVAHDTARTLPDPNDTLGWYFLEALLKEWLNGKRHVIPKGQAGPPRTTFFISDDKVRMHAGFFMSAGMDWALTYEKVRDVYESLVDVDSLKTDQVFIDNLATHFFKDPTILPTVGSRFWVDIVNDAGASEGGMKTKYEHQLRSGLVHYETWENIQQFIQGWDGLCVALHGFYLYLVVSGKVTSVRAQEVEVELDQLGVFFKDNFDFSDGPGEKQFLGPWRVPYRYLRPPILLYNQNYRTYRDLTGMGKDFYVISRNKVIELFEENKLRFVLRRCGTGYPKVDPNNDYEVYPNDTALDGGALPGGTTDDSNQE